MSNRAGVAMLVLAACGKPADPPHGMAARPAAANPMDAARWLECTEASRAPMEALLLRRHQLAALDDRIDGLTCVTIQLAGQPAFFVELVGSHDEQRRRLHGVIATDGKTELLALRDAPLDWAVLRGRKVWFETTDLDGDGTEDLVVHRGDERHPTAEWIDVIAIRDAGLVELKGPRIAYDDPDLDESCRGKLTTEHAGRATHLVVTTTASSGKSEHCLDPGRHVFALDADRLVSLSR